jgi:hypothetical protein
VAAPVPPAPPAAQSAPALRLPPPSSPNESDDTAAFVAQFVKKQSPPAPPADAGDQTPPGQVPSAQVQLPPGQPEPSSPDESDDTAAFVAQFVHAQQAPATANMVAAQGSNPDKTAQAMATAAKLGLPVPAVEADPQHYADLAKLSDDRQVVARDPALQDWIKQDPTNAKLAIDDIAHLGVIGRLSRGLDEGRLQYQEGGVEAKNALAGPFGGPSAANINLLDAIKTQLQLAQGQDELADEARAQTAMAQRGGQPAMQGHLTERGFAPQAGEYAASVPGMGVYGDVAQGVGEFAGASKPIAEQAALAAGTYALGPLGVAYRTARMVGAGGEVGMAVAPALGRAAGMGLGKAAQMLGPAALTAMVGNQVVSSYGQIYDAQNGVKDANGQEIPETTKQLVAAGGAILAGGVMAAGGGAQLGRLLNLPKITFVHDLAVAAARVPTVQRAFGNLFAGAAKAGIVNALLGMGINGVQSVAPQIGMAVTSPNFETVFNNPDKYAALKKEIIEGWEDNLLLGAGLHVPAAGVSLMYDVGRASAAGRAAELWGGMMDAAAQSKTRMRAPASFEALMKAHSGDAVYVNGDALATYYQEIGSAPGAKNDPFAQVVPDMKDQLERAQLTGGVVEIPRASFAARLAGSNADYRLRPHIKITPDGMSAEEAQQFLNDNPDMFKGFDLESLAANGGEGPTRGHTFEVVNVAENSDDAKNPLLTVRDETGQEIPVQAEDFNNFMQGRQATITRGEGGTGKVGEHANTLEVGDIVRTAEGAREAVRADVMRQLQAAGQTENQAKTNAALFVAFFGTMGRLMGLSPEAIYQAENIQIQREAAYVAGPGRYDDLDAAIDANRAGRGGPSDREIYGPSLLEYLTEKPNPRTLAEAQNMPPRKLAGGLVDTGGNLKSMGAGVWHLEVKTRRKLINENGQRLHEAAKDAYDARYFPEHTTTTTPEQLLAAIRDELHGKKRYPEMSYEAQEKLHQRELVNYVNYLANEAGLDLKSMTNDQVRQAFAEFEGQAAPKPNPDAEFDQTVYRGTPQFEQRQGETKRGSIQFHEGLTLINLFKNADASTFPHEAAHLFLDIMDRAVRTPDATAEMRTDMGKLRKWLGVGEDENLRDNVAAHEKFARGFETYLKEGNPPSEELRGVFAKLSAWITRVYQRLKQSGQPINDEVRGIMDRMLATREAVDEAQAAMGTLNPTFKDAKMAGMSGTQFNLYVNKIAKKQDEIYDRVLARVSKMEEIRQTKAWNDERAAQMPHVEYDVIQGNPGARTWSYFAYAKDLLRPDREIPRTKLSEAAVKAILGERIMGLPDGILARKKVQAGEGKLIVVHPDDVAAAFGYSTGKQMLEDMIAANIGRRNAEQATGRDMSLNGYVRHLTEQAIRDRLNEMFGDPLHDGTIAEIAQEEAHKASTLDLISTELRALAKRNGEPPPWSVEQAKAWVQESFLKTSIRQAIKPGPYIKAEQKAARDAEIALLRGNVVDALKAKQRQMLAHIAAGEAQAFKKMYDKTVANWKNLGKTVRLPKIEPHFADQIHAILDTIGIPIARDADELRRGTAGQNLTDFIADRQEQGWQIDVPLFLHNVVGNQWLRPGQYDYRDFNTHDFMLTSDLITSLKHVGKEVNEILVGEKREDFQSRKAQMLEEAKDVPNIWRESGTRVPKGLELVLTRGLLGTGRELKANLRRLENAMIMLGGRHGRAFVSAMVDALKISAARKDKYMEKVHQQFKDLYASMPKEWRERDDDKIDVPECPKNGSTLWSRESLRMVAMNMGNTGDRSNFEKMYKGEGWDAEAVYDALRSKKYLTADDWNYVQGVWNIMDEWKPVFDEFQRRMTGVGITYVKAEPITTGHGQTLRGGYFPVMYDAVNANTAMMREKIEGVEGQESDKGPYGRGSLAARTYQGAMVNRTGYFGPLTYDPIAFANRFTDMIHDLAYRESIMNAWKLVNDPEIKAMMIDKLGPELQAKFNPWLRDLAGMSGKLDNRDRFMQNMTKRFRLCSTAMYIGFNLMTTALHGPTAYIHSLGETDKLAAIKNSLGLADFRMSNPRWQFIMNNSLECAELAKHVDLDARQNLRSILQKENWQTKTLNVASQLSQWLLAKSLVFSAGVVWETEYEKLMDQGMEHEEAALAADRAVRVSHGGVNFMDQAEAFRSEGIMRNLLWFGGFWNSIFNKYVDTIAIGKRGVYAARAGDMQGAKEDFGKVLSNTFTYLLMPAVITAAARGYLQGDKPDNESFEKWYLENLLVEPAQPLPIINAVANMWLRHQKTPDVFGPEETISDIVAAGRNDYDLFQTGQYDPNILLHNVEAVGSVVPLPGAVPLTKAGEYLWDWGDGNLPQQTLADVAKGVLRGPPH